MMTQFDFSSYPGKWRPGAVRVVNSESGTVVYNAPDMESVDSLMGELVAYLDRRNHESFVVAAAMAHLNMTMIHPFKDGNGRMARALQTLALAREGVIHPLFSSVEEWLGAAMPGSTTAFLPKWEKGTGIRQIAPCHG